VKLSLTAFVLVFGDPACKKLVFAPQYWLGRLA